MPVVTRLGWIAIRTSHSSMTAPQLSNSEQPRKKVG